MSHSRDQVAVRWSLSAPCAVDIECPGRNFAGVADRYLNAGERMLGGDCAEWLCIAWCAKECLYKLGRECGADLLRDIRLTAFDPDAGMLAGSLRGRIYSLQTSLFGSDRAVWNP